MPSLLDIIMRAQPATEGDVSDSLATAGDNPLLREFLRLQGRRVRDAVTAPRDAYTGDLQVFDPATGHVSDEALERASNAAGLAMTGGLPMTAPAGSLRMFAGRNSATADKVALAKAESMASTGAEPRAIWDETGWFQGADGKWRYEIPDNASQIGTAAADKFLDGEPLKGKVAGNYWHKDLYAAYPELRRLDVNVERAGDYRAPFAGSYDGRMIEGRAASTGDARELMLHELQHGVQNAEGFAKGGDPARLADQMPDPQAINDARVMAALIKRGTPADDAPLAFMNMLGRDPDPASRYLIREMSPDELTAMPSDGMEAYKRLAGEVEARNVQFRRDMTPEERRIRPPWETQDVPNDRQILNLGMGIRF